MAKKSSAKAETTPVIETAETEKVAEPAKKTAPKKVAPKKVAPKKPAAVVAATQVAKTTKAEVAETKINFVVEFGGTQVSIDDVIKNIKTAYGKDAKEISVYLKPEESKAYFVADDQASAIDVYFC